jgi:hypothetical protein
MSVPTRFTSVYWHDSVPGYVAVVSYWKRPWKELLEDHRRLRRGEDPADHETVRKCTVRLRPRRFTGRPRVKHLVFTVHGQQAARRFARGLLADMADVADPTILASARVQEGEKLFSGWVGLPVHYMDFLRSDLSLAPAVCGCEGPCRCTATIQKRLNIEKQEFVMNPNHHIEHDHEAIRAMLAERAADDTSWDQPPLLFALVHDPDAGYGIVPVRPFNEFLHQHLGDYPFSALLRQLAANALTIEQQVPGLDVLRNAVQVCREDRAFAREWFPKVSERTVACGLVVRTEAWKVTRPNDGTPYPEGPLADVPGAIESLNWKAVVDDDTFDWVWWDRGAAAPESNYWSFDSELYRSTKDQQRVPTLMRKIVRVSARVSHMPWPRFPDALPDDFEPGPFRRC